MDCLSALNNIIINILFTIAVIIVSIIITNMITISILLKCRKKQGIGWVLYHLKIVARPDRHLSDST